MSLIEDALRRVQDPSAGVKTPPKPETSKQETAQPHSWSAETPAATPAVKPSAPAVSSQQPWILVVVLAAVAGCTIALIAGGVIWIKTALSSGGRAPAQHLDVSVSPQGAKPEQKISRATSPANPLNLNGVVAGEGTPYAVINGKIFGIGERVEGAKVIAIDSRSVILEYENGQQTTLTVPR